MKGMHSGCCYPTGNKYRGGHDDGSRKQRARAGKMSYKHHTGAIHKSMSKGNPY